ncbi:MAG: alkaline phosphatase family protein [Candidatus Woesearchaeota archaeon]
MAGKIKTRAPSKTKTLIFFIDAVRPDYIENESAPFLYSLKKKQTYLDVKSLLGFSSGIHPSIWTGKYQERHGFFLVYMHDPKNSPFKWISSISFVPSKLREYILASLKAPFYMTKINKKYFPAWYKQKILSIPASIDPKNAGFFSTGSTAYPMDFFDILKKNGMDYSSQPDFDFVGTYGHGVGVQNWELTDKPVDFFFVYETDPIAHYSGPRSHAIKNKMQEIDTKIKSIYSEAVREYGKADIFVFSDHGMVDVKHTIDVKVIVENSGLTPIKDYVVFYDSTMVRFWVNNEKAKKRIITLLSKIKHLTYLDDKLKAKYRIRFRTRKWGDLLFLASPGYRIFPDYFAPVRFNTKGMHGYWPEHPDSKGIFITNAFKTAKKEISVVDFMPTMLKAMGLEKEIPKKIDGKAVF